MMARAFIIAVAQAVLLVGAAGATELTTTSSAAHEAAPAPAAEAAPVDEAASPAVEKAAAEAELEKDMAAARERLAQPGSDTTVTTDPAPPEEDAAPPRVKALARELAENPSGKRPLFIAGTVEYRSLAIADDDPANDRGINYSLLVGRSLYKGSLLFMRFGVAQRFVAEPDESGFEFQDVRVGMRYAHRVNIEAIDKALSFQHFLSVRLPTSRESRRQDLYAAPSWLSRVRVPTIENLYVGVDGAFQYRFHQYAERAGLEGGMNNQLLLFGLLVAEYQVFSSDRFGSLFMGLDVNTTYAKRYASREEFESEASSQDFWSHFYGWDLYAIYSPLPFLQLSTSLEHGGPVLRNGVVNTFLTHRDETQLTFAVTAFY